MNNQFNNNFNNQYNNQYNDPYNNQFNNYGMQQSFNQQKVPYINRNDNRGGGFLSFLIALLLLIGCGALLLHFLGYMDLSEYIPILDKFNDVEKNSSSSNENNQQENHDSNKQEEKKDDKDENQKEEQLSESEKAAKSMCSLVDKDGNYVKDENNLCRENICVVLTEDIGYTYDCNSNKSNKVDLDELKVETSLEYSCSKVDESGSYSNEELGLNCSNFVCTLNYENVNYTRVCNVEE